MTVHVSGLSFSDLFSEPTVCMVEDYTKVSSSSDIDCYTELYGWISFLKKQLVASVLLEAEDETPNIWPPDSKNWLIWKGPDAEKDWGQEEKGTIEGEMVGWNHH